MSDFNRWFHESLTRGEFPFLSLLGIEDVEIARGRASFRLRVEEKHLRSLGILHGGVTAALLDTALGVAGASHAPPDHHAVTMQLNIHFTRIARAGAELLATGEALHAGKTTAVCRGEVRTADGELIAAATSTIMFMPVK